MTATRPHTHMLPHQLQQSYLVLKVQYHIYACPIFLEQRKHFKIDVIASTYTAQGKF